MQMLDRIRCRSEYSSEEQNPAEYWRRISTEMNLLYVISFLLTAKKEDAENGREKTLDEFIEGLGDFIEWARTRGRDAALEYEFSITKPDSDATGDEMDVSDGLFSSARNHLFRAITALPAFGRFVFAMANIYGKSDTECARFLGAERWKVTIAGELSEHILTAKFDEGPPSSSKPSTHCDGAYLFSLHCSTC